jgi:hypothetical protein
MTWGSWNEKKDERNIERKKEKIEKCNKEAITLEEAKANENKEI